jgi:hypothetical protein
VGLGLKIKVVPDRLLKLKLKFVTKPKPRNLFGNLNLKETKSSEIRLRLESDEGSCEHNG